MGAGGEQARVKLLGSGRYGEFRRWWNVDHYRRARKDAFPPARVKFLFRAVLALNRDRSGAGKYVHYPFPVAARTGKLLAFSKLQSSEIQKPHCAWLYNLCEFSIWPPFDMPLHLFAPAEINHSPCFAIIRDCRKESLQPKCRFYRLYAWVRAGNFGHS